MNSRLRKEYIIENLRQHEKLTYEQLSVMLGVSVDTTRRDIDALANSGLVTKVKRGAQAKFLAHTQFGLSKQELTDASMMLAHRAARIIQPGQTIVFDDGKLPLMIVRFLPRDINLTIITHSFAIASLAFEFPNIKLMFAGGLAAKDSWITTGSDVLKKFNTLHGDISFLNARHLHLDFGVTEPEIYEGEIKARISRMSGKLVVTAEPASLGSISTIQVCTLDRIDYLAMDIDSTSALVMPVLKAGIKLL